MSYQNLFNTLWNDYTHRNPHAENIHQLFLAQGEKNILNDHVAFRTFNHPNINIDVLAKFFIAYGYQEKGTYQFAAKKLFAKHYEHSDPAAPKVFISELLTHEFSPALQSVVKSCVERIPESLLDTEQFLYSGASWSPLSYETYQSLLRESEYAAWMYAFGFCANHFTVNVNAFDKFNDISKVNQLLQQNNFMLNSSGGLIKGAPKDYLEQSSTMAEEVDVQFEEGIYKIPSCYYEFAKRYPLPTGSLYTGFVAASADKIFESTDVLSR